MNNFNIKISIIEIYIKRSISKIVHSFFNINFMYFDLGKSGVNLWLDGRYSQADQYFVDSNGNQITYFNWAANQPGNQLTQNDCIQVGHVLFYLYTSRLMCYLSIYR